jgi:hypothetical protein
LRIFCPIFRPVQCGPALRWPSDPNVKKVSMPGPVGAPGGSSLPSPAHLGRQDNGALTAPELTLYHTVS